jgi:hypothetical protein
MEDIDAWHWKGLANRTSRCRALTARHDEGCNSNSCEKGEKPKQTSRDATRTITLASMLPIAFVFGRFLPAWMLRRLLCALDSDRQTHNKKGFDSESSIRYCPQESLLSPLCMRGCLRCGYTFLAFVLFECLVLLTQEALGDFPRKMGRGQPFGGKAKKEQLKAKKAAKREQAENAGDEFEWGSRARKSGDASRQKDASNAQEGARQPRHEGRGGGILIAPRNKLRTVFEREPQVYDSPFKAYSPAKYADLPELQEVIEQRKKEATKPIIREKSPIRSQGQEDFTTSSYKRVCAYPCPIPCVEPQQAALPHFGRNSA